MLLDTAVSDIWMELCQSPETDALIASLQSLVQLGELSLEEFWRQFVEEGISLVQKTLRAHERSRDRAKGDYRRLRECLHKSGQFLQDESGKAYGPPDLLTPQSPIAREEQVLPFSDLPAPPRIATDRLFSQKEIVPQARLFWQAYIANRHYGIAHFVPIYFLYLWLCQVHDIGKIQEQSLYNEEDGQILSEAELSGASPADSPLHILEGRELLERVDSFVYSLSEREIAFCALYYYDNARMEDVAKAMGLKQASGVARIKKSFLQKLQAFMAEYEDLLDETDYGMQLAQDFLDAVCAECKKCYLAPNTQARRNSHDQ